MSPVSMLMIHNPMTIAYGSTSEMQRAIDMLSEVKESIINAYEIKTGLSRNKISKLMDNETWMDARKAVELGFADSILKRDEIQDIDIPNVSMLYQEATVQNSMMNKIKETFKNVNEEKIKADSLINRLDLIKNWR